MQINTLEIKNFRNYSEGNLNFSPGCNILYGENGQGKTNILESVYYCGFGKSHKGSREREIIRFGEEEAHIKAEFKKHDSSMRIDVHLRKDKGKGLAINRVPIKKLSELYGRVLVVIFSTEDLDIVKRSPSVRRAFVDMELCQIDPIYLEDLVNYGKLLKNRHEILKMLDEGRENRTSLLEMLDIYDLQLSGYGSRIIKRRREFLEELEKTVYDIHYDLTGGKEKIKIVYEPSAEEDEFYEVLLKNRERDIFHKATHSGPHRDDISFYAGDKNLKIYGSNGQQRTCAIALKLSELKIIENIKNDRPILLLDDVLSELDRGRQEKLLKNIEGVQTILTSTGVDEFVNSRIKSAKVFNIDNANVREV